MKTEKIDLYDYFHVARKGADGGYLTLYVRTSLQEIKPKERPAMLVMPGGGYGWVSDREGEPVALRFMAEGYSAFVLHYSCLTPFPTPLIEACMAVAYIRENAGCFCVDEEEIAAIGFSAGGHLAGMLATMYDAPQVKSALGERAALTRPNAVVLSYPVVTMKDNLTHEGTRQVISDNGKIPYDELSIENRVDGKSVPAFIWHTLEDPVVPVENSLMLASAYRAAGVPFALHIFEKGWHGLSLCNEEVNDGNAEVVALAHVGKWAELALDWLKSRGFTVRIRK